MEEIDHEVDMALRNAKKTLKNEEDCKSVTLDDFKSGYD